MSRRVQTWTDISPENFIDPRDETDSLHYDDDSVYIACYGGIFHESG